MAAKLPQRRRPPLLPMAAAGRPALPLQRTPSRHGGNSSSLCFLPQEQGLPGSTPTPLLSPWLRPSLLFAPWPPATSPWRQASPSHPCGVPSAPAIHPCARRPSSPLLQPWCGTSSDPSSSSELAVAHGAPTPCYIFSRPPLTLPTQPAQEPSSPWRPSPLSQPAPSPSAGVPLPCMPAARSSLPEPSHIPQPRQTTTVYSLRCRACAVFDKMPKPQQQRRPPLRCARQVGPLVVDLRSPRVVVETRGEKTLAAIAAFIFLFCAR
jgi:hypothetical protein